MMTPTSTFAECDKQVSLKMNGIIRSMGQGRGPKEQGARRAAHSAQEVVQLSCFLATVRSCERSLQQQFIDFFCIAIADSAPAETKSLRLAPWFVFFHEAIEDQSCKRRS